MKQYKNVYLAVAFYVLTIIFYFALNSPVTIPFFACSLIGILFAHMSNRKKESKWAGNLLIVIGALLLLFPFYITSLIIIIDSIFIR